MANTSPLKITAITGIYTVFSYRDTGVPGSTLRFVTDGDAKRFLQGLDSFSVEQLARMAGVPNGTTPTQLEQNIVAKLLSGELLVLKGAPPAKAGGATPVISRKATQQTAEVHEDPVRLEAVQREEREKGEYKIAVEITGADIDQTGGSLGVTEIDGDPLSAMDAPIKNAGTDQHRYEVFFELVPNKPRTLVYRVHCTGDADGTMPIPLAKDVEPVSMGASADPWDNVLVPLKPLRYTDLESTPKAAMPLRPGWVYVFLNGTLWRELEVTNNVGGMREVDLEATGGEDTREAMGGFTPYLLVPHTLKGELQTVEIAFSEVQWSWAYIGLMGGLTDDDFRFPAKGKARKALEGIDPDDDLRRQRMQVINFGKKKKPELKTAAGDESGVAEMTPVEEAEAVTFGQSDKDYLTSIRHRKIPVVYLRDPINVARLLAYEYQRAWCDMEQCLEEIKKNKWFDTALLVNKYFFGVNRKPADNLYWDAERKKNWERNQKRMRELQGLLSEDDIKNVLGAARREEIRERMVEVKRKLAHYLDHRTANRGHLIAALDDYFHLPELDYSGKGQCRPGYEYAWKVAEELFARLADHPYTLDDALEVDQNKVKKAAESDPGIAFLVRLSKPGGAHPLSERLFPDFNKSGALGASRSVGNRKLPKAPNPIATWQRVAEASRRGVHFMAEFIGHFAGVADKIVKEGATEVFGRLLYSIDLSGGLKQMEFTLGDFVDGKLKGYRLVGYQILESEGVNPRGVYRFGDGSAVMPDGSRKAIYAHSGSRVVGAADPAGLEDIRKLNRLTHEEFGPLLRDDAAWRQLRVKLIVEPELSDFHKATKQVADGDLWKKAVPALAIFVEAMNLAFVIRSMPPPASRSREDDLIFAGALADLAAVTSGIIATRQLQQGIDAGLYTANGPLPMRFRIVPFLGTVAGALSFCASGQETLKAWRYGDDHVIGQSVMTVGFATQTVQAGIALFGAETIAANGIAGVLGLSSPVGWIALGLVLTGAVLAAFVFTKDSPLEQWLKVGPFGADPGRRFGGYDGKGQPGDKFGIWRSNPRAAYRALHDALFRPNVAAAYRRLPPDVSGVRPYAFELVVRIVTPYYVTGQSKLDVLIGHQENDRWVWARAPEPTFVRANHEVRYFLPWTYEGATKVRTRIDLYGNGTVVLPLTNSAVLDMTDENSVVAVAQPPQIGPFSHRPL